MGGGGENEEVISLPQEGSNFVLSSLTVSQADIKRERKESSV